ncbi:hypothetical protein GCM10012288_04760 [Malaciobacter pacificus]|uniref:Uncharacterized protein n=1 Tax=Malaciobacter pacificus TaxID=1080223 RepID=A0A5C2HCI0_9BACT|nr:hypothetical protein [Malaciobacter pacificus]QEP34524.1 hypothetical protein APAC_1415 [Malaciobacter pacificus]GGD33817.1 hypothetical protein GCM10012288_04760 [Malaciobacter pacificus]
MYKILVPIFLTIFFTSCSSKNSASEYFKNSTINTQIIQFTKKTDIKIDNQPKVLIWATYLNGLEKYKDLKNETFLVTTYFTNQESNGIETNGYELFLNDKKSQALQKLSEDSIYKELFIKNKWASKYLVTFDEIIKEQYELNLIIKNNTSKAQLKFEK